MDQYAILGAAAVVTLMLVDRVIMLVKATREKRNGHNGLRTDVAAAAVGVSAGGQTIEFWRRANREAVEESIAAMLAPILNKQTDILARMEDREGKMHEMMLRHGFVLDDVQKSVEKLRVTNHEINQHLQKLVP